METMIWIFVLALVVVLYVVTGLEAVNTPIMRRSILRGGLYGSLAGVILGPIAIIIFMFIHNILYGTTFLGLEIVAGPIFGPPVFGVLGSFIGAIRGIRSTLRTRYEADAIPRVGLKPISREGWDE